jgi:hypothetical protein
MDVFFIPVFNLIHKVDERAFKTPQKIVENFYFAVIAVCAAMTAVVANRGRVLVPRSA